MTNISNSKLLDLTDKVAIVTGGAVGIGLGISERLAAAGAKVLIADLNTQTGTEAVKKITSQGLKAHFIQTDVSKETDVQKMTEEAVKVFGGIDILVNNAGIYPNQLVMNMLPADFDKVINVNLKGVYLTTHMAAHTMIKQNRGGKIINVTSIDALHPSSAGLAHYDASKHGVWGFSKNVALELAPHKIWVNCVAPGGIATPGVQASSGNAPAGVDMQKMMEAFMSKIPMRRMGEPDDIGKVVLFLASDMASYMTGTQIVVDGGYLLS